MIEETLEGNPIFFIQEDLPFLLIGIGMISSWKY